MNANAAAPAISDNIIPLPDRQTSADVGIGEPNKTAAPTAARTPDISPAGKPGLPVERFKYRGRAWSIRKRRDDPDANWQLYFEDRGRRYPFSLGTASKQLAITEAKLKIDLHFDGRTEALRQSMQRPGNACSTFADVFAIALQLDIDARTDTARKNYIWGTRYVIAHALELRTPADVDALSTSVLTAETAEKFFARARAHERKIAGQAKANTFRRTCNQAFCFCCALFAPRATRSMKRDFKLTVPETIAAFRACQETDRFNVPTATFQRPAPAVLRSTLTEWLRIARTPGYPIPGGAHMSCRPREIAPLSDIARRNMFIAIGLMLAFGLRKAEVKKVRWNWFQTVDGMPMLRCQDVDVKGGTNEINIVALDPFYRILMRTIARNNWRGSPNEYCLIERPKVQGAHPTLTGLKFAYGGHTDRTYWPAMDVSHWLRSLGWETQKTNHALRDYSASLITMRYGLDAASRWCRHKNRATTESHYNGFVELGKMANPKLLAWIRWAK